METPGTGTSAEEMAEAVAAAPPSRTLTLRVPVEFGSETISELTFKLNAQAFRNFGLPMQADGTIIFQPYELAKVGIRMAGQPPALLDRLDPADLWEVAQRVLGFIVPGHGTGPTR